MLRRLAAMKSALLRGVPRGATRPLLVTLLLSLAIGYAAERGLLDPLSVLITVGGTFAVAWITFPGQRLLATWRRVVEVLRGPPADDDAAVEGTIAELKRLARVYRVEGGPALDRAAREQRDPFLRMAIERSLEYPDGDELRDALLGEARRAAAEGEAARGVLLTFGKLFPAFGLIGTLIGLALLLPDVGAGNLAAAGPSLGISILTTLYGAVLSNVVVLPIATKLSAALARRALVLQMVVLGAELIHRREYPTRVERALRSCAGLAPLAVRGDLTVLSDRAA
jgi:chemotaxis protein MotA